MLEVKSSAVNGAKDLKQSGSAVAMVLPGRPSLLRLTALILILSGLVGLAACTGSGDSAGRAGTATCVAPGITETEIKAGVLFPDTGPFSYSMRAFRAGIEARLGEVNIAGGVNGRKIVYTWRDDASDPQVNLTAARELIQKEEVFGIMEGLGAVSGSAQYLADLDVPVIGLGAEPVWAAHENMFTWHNYTLAAGSSTVWGDFIRGTGGTRAAVVDVALNDAVQDYHRQLVDSLWAAGVSVDINFEVTAETTGFGALARQMKAANIDTITGVVTPDVLAQILPAVRAAGVNLRTVLLSLGYDRDLLKKLGPVLAGTSIYISFLPFELNTPAHQRLLTAMARYSSQSEAPEQESAVFGWLSADLFLRGLQAGGACPNRQSFIQGLRAVHDYGGAGLLPAPVDLAKNRGQLTDCYYFVRVSDDGRQFVPLQSAARCGNLIN
ncbi:ABC transporter substrate-binding protein [Frankia sp. Mgl5]|uniref:ABC transporter substrate-binding protein n=1 Tax=Frankia sp. Mgl5 TaxID=2933793 RepID=UPI00200DBC6F|nr:ABC transporter substrate-binding protein [Frankia sp. Mgl5]MCK9931330.1 ABC transporter substrate-binding protein [Frankia sp. Mgl5]